MTKAKRQAVIFRIVFYGGFVGFVAAVNFELKRLGQIPFIAPAVPLPPGFELSIITTMGDLIISLSTALLGALGFLLVNGHKVKRGLWPKTLAVVSGASAAISIYFGYLLYQTALEMAPLQIADANLPAFLWARQYQFFAFLLAVLLFGDFAIDTLLLEDENDSKHHDARP